MLTGTTNVRALTMVPSPLRNTGRAAPGTIWLQHISIATVLMLLFASVCYPADADDDSRPRSSRLHAGGMGLHRG